MKKQFTCEAIKWFDRVNGNTYHSVRITRHSDGAVVYGAFQYGYGEQYKQTALKAMLEAGWLNNFMRKSDDTVPMKEHYTADTVYLFERENGYPIIWIENNGLKRECIANGMA